jgi:DNA-binding Lrp family transcriptional regulator
MTRDQIHNRIKELVELIEINHSRIYLNDSDLKLDLEQLRGHVVDLYTCVDQLGISSNEKGTAPKANKKTSVEVEELPEPKPVTPVDEPKIEPSPDKLELIVESIPIKEEEEIVPVPVVQREIDLEEQTPVTERAASPKEEKSESKQEQPAGDRDVYAKLRQKKLDSIKKGISISKRYQFQNELFENSADNYNHSISQLDGAESLEQADQILSEFAIQYSWDEEHVLVEELAVLLQRRYL